MLIICHSIEKPSQGSRKFPYCGPAPEKWVPDHRYGPGVGLS